MTCECRHLNKDHKVLNFASGKTIQRCLGMGTERRPIELGSNTWCTHYNCPCKIDMTPKTYVVKARDRRDNQVYYVDEYPTMEEAEKRKERAEDECDLIWCENHTHWIETIE